MPQRLANADYLNGKHAPLLLIRRDPQTEFPLHGHEFSELVLVYRGSGTHWISGTPRKISAGDVFLIHGSTKHAYTGLQDLALLNLLFDLHELHNPLSAFPGYPALRALFLLDSANGGLHLEGEAWEKTMDLADQIEAEQKLGAQDSPVAIASLFLLLILHLGRCARAAGLSDPEDAVSRIDSLVDAMTEHPLRKWTRKEMTRLAGMSASTLTRHFRLRTGCPPLEYLIRLRLKKAEHFLMDPAISVSEAADLAGFPDSNYFCRQFRSHYGVPPGKYRQSDSSSSGKRTKQPS